MGGGKVGGGVVVVGETQIEVHKSVHKPQLLKKTEPERIRTSRVCLVITGKRMAGVYACVGGGCGNGGGRAKLASRRKGGRKTKVEVRRTVSITSCF